MKILKQLKVSKHAIILPLIVMWLEMVLHAAGGMDLKYCPIYLLYGASLGFLLSAIVSLIGKTKPKRITGDALGCFLCLFYAAEYTCKEILQSYYPFSVLGTAAENKLFQFIGIIVQVVLKSILLYIIMFLPMITIAIDRKTSYIGKHVKKLEWKDEAKTAPINVVLLLVIAAALHLLGYAAVMLPDWKVDLTPKELYVSDTNYDDQVAELGLYNFIRIDVRNQIWTPQAEEFDADSLEGLEVLNTAPEKSEEATQEAGEEPAEKVIDTSPNVLDIDLAAFAESASNKDIKWLAEYFNSVTPTNKNEYTGMFEGYNLVFITVEAMSGYGLDPKYTPTLWKMAKGGFVFNNFYTALHYTSTSNGECQNLLGLYPKNGNPISIKRTGELKTNMPFALAQQLGRKGYTNWGYHDNWDLYGRMYSHSNLGYFWQFSYNGLHGELKSNGELEWPQRDALMFEESFEDFVAKDDPFNIYYLTVSGHTPFGWNWTTKHYREALTDAPYSEQTKGYIASLMEVDKGVSELMEQLEAAGKLDKTLFVIAPDHIPYTGVEILEELTGQEFGSSDAARAINEQGLNFDLYKSALIIWSSSMEKPVQVDKVCCQVDILPTVSNLMGLEYDSRMLSGTDIFSSSEGLVVFSSKCWKSDRGFYDRYTQKFTPAEGVSMTEEEQKAYVEAMKTLVQCKLDCTSRIIENDFYDKLLGDRLERIPGAISPHN